LGVLSIDTSLDSDQDGEPRLRSSGYLAKAITAGH
jgi:hypothetical protein